MPALSIENVTKHFGVVRALDGLTLSAALGEVTAVLGPNGAGKTTMIRCCTGLFPPTSGTITVAGQQAGSREAAARIGLLPQSVGAWSNIKVIELLRYLASMSEHPQPVADLVELFGLGSFAQTTYRRLSGGQQRSVNFAAALVGRPQLVFLDEPTSGLDPHMRHHSWGIMRQLREAGVAVVLTTHSMEEAEQLADWVIIVDAGRVQVQGTVAALTATESLESVFLRSTKARVDGLYP